MEEQARPFVTSLQAAAAQAHEMFAAFCEAGFTDEQALQLVIAIVTSNSVGHGG